MNFRGIGILALASGLLGPVHSGLATAVLPINPGKAKEFVLDPGHSPGKPGAESCSGTYEYIYNNNLVSTIMEYLGALAIQAEVTRSPDGEVSLEERARFSVGKKLFIAVHHDSAQKQFIKQVKGHPCSNKAEGFSIFVSGENEFFQESLAAARVLGQSLRNSGLSPSRHHGEKIQGENRKLLDENLGIYLFDDLVVLKKAQSPALLLEAGVIINPVDDDRVKTKAYQLKIAEAVAEAMKFARFQSLGSPSPGEHGLH